MRALVEHDALGAAAHGRVGHLGPRGQALLGQRLQHLRGPDHRHVRRFAQPQDLLLHFGQPLETHLDRQVPAGHHHADRRGPQRRQQQVRQLFKGRPRLDLQDDAQMRSVAAVQFAFQIEHIFGRPHERQADHVRTGDGEIQLGQVLLAERRHAQTAVGEVDALVGPEFRTAGAGFGDPDPQTALRRLLDQAPDLAVVEEDALAGSYVGEHLRQRTRDARRCQDQTVGGAGRGTARRPHPGQYQDVALSQDQRLVASRQGPDPTGDGAVHCGSLGRASRLPVDRRAGLDVRRRTALGQHPPSVHRHDPQAAIHAAAVGQQKIVAGLHLSQPGGVHWQQDVLVEQRWTGGSGRHQPHPDGTEQLPAQAPSRAPMDHRGPGLHRSGPQLGSLQVEQDAAGPVHFGGRPSQVLGHPPPGRRLIVGAVDAHDIHACQQEVADQVVGIRGLRRHGDHDPNLAAGGRRSQEELRMLR